MISSEYPPKWGGVGVCSFYLSTWMAKLGHEVHVVTRKQGIGYEPSHPNIKVHPVSWLKAPLLFTTSFGRNAVKWYERSGIDFDLVHVHSNMALLRKEDYGRLKCPLVSTMHGTWWGERSTISFRDLTFSPSAVNDLAIMTLGPLMDKYEDIALELSNGVIIESLSEVRDIKKRGVQNRYGRWIRLPPGIDTDEFHPDKADPRALSELGIDDRKPLIISVGRWAARKGIREVLSCYEKVRKVHPDVQLALVGWGPLEGEITRRIRSKGLERSVFTFRSLPFKTMQTLVASADLALFHSYWEGFGLTIGEALSSGTPVVATNVGGAPEMVTDLSGRLVRVGDVDGQAKAVLELLGRDDLDCMGLRGREHIVDRFSWDMVSKRTTELYEWVIEDPRNEKGWRGGFQRCS
jgi:glycosyltransferase involved in cell wall biosynthesis